MDFESEINALKEELKQLSKTVYIGNGTPSLVSRTTKLETDMVNMKNDIAATKANSAWLIKLVISQIVLAVSQYLPKIAALVSQ
jgi:hypothetical protein